MSDKKIDVLDLINRRPEQKGTFRMGSVTFDDDGAYRTPQTIRRHGLPRAAKPPVFDTGHDPHTMGAFPRYSDGTAVSMPGLPVPERRKVPAIKED